MEEKILALLIAAFTGVRKDGLNQMARILALQATTDEEAKALVDKLTKTQVDKFVKEFRAEVDKEVSESNKTHEKNLKQKFDFVEKNPEPAKQKDDKPDDIAALIKTAVTEAVKPFQAELSGYKENEIAKTRLQLLTDKVKTCKDESFKAKVLKDFGRMKFETDEAFNEYLTDTENDVATANQSYADTKLGGHRTPYKSAAGGDNKEATKEEVDAVVSKLRI